MKKLFCGALVALSVTALASCGNKGDAPSDAFVPSMDKNTTCTISVHGSYERFEALKAVGDEFKKVYPNVKVDYVPRDDYEGNLETILNGNDKPNIFFSYTRMQGEAYKSVVEHMEDLSDPALKLNLDCLRPGLINRTADNKVNLVPIFTRTYGALVNTDLFQKESIAVPKNWDGLLDACKSFREKDYKSPVMGYSRDSSSPWMNMVAYPMFVAELAKHPGAIDLANKPDAEAGKYMRGALETVDRLVKEGCVDNAECDKIEENYKKVLLRFFEGDVPMMLCHGDTVSGSVKREGESEAYKKSPFKYAFYPFPVTDQGGYFIDSLSLGFSVNKYCDNLDMTNEFMRFLISESELTRMSTVKRLGAPTKVMSSDPIYAPFGEVPPERIYSTELLGVKDMLATQIKKASFKVGKGEITIDEAIANYGKF